MSTLIEQYNEYLVRFSNSVESLWADPMTFEEFVENYCDELFENDNWLADE